MRHFALKKNKYFRPSINLDKVWTLVSEETRTKYASSAKIPVIDVTKAVGFNHGFNEN